MPLSRQILVQENDYVKAGMPLSDGAITPSDILAIQGPTKVQEYIVNEVQEVYRGQGVKINDKHFEIIVRQMMNKVQIQDPGDTRFLEEQIVDKWEFMEENDSLYDKVVVTDAGDSQNVQPGMIISMRKLRDENSILKRKDQKLVEVRDIVPATSSQILQGITRAALQTSSFMSAASFQETTKVLNEAAIHGKVDPLENLKENVICGHLIPAGTASATGTTSSWFAEGVRSDGGKRRSEITVAKRGKKGRNMVPPLFLFQRLCRGKTLPPTRGKYKKDKRQPGRFDEKMRQPGTLKFGMNFGDGRLNRFELRLQFAGRTERITLFPFSVSV